jgi:hypothetical protein
MDDRYVKGPGDIESMVINRAIQVLCSWLTSDAAWLCGDAGSTRGYANLTQLRFHKVLLEKAGWTCEERKDCGHYSYEHELVVSAKPESFHTPCKVPDVKVISPYAIRQTLEHTCKKKIQQSMKDEDVQDQLLIYGRNVTFEYYTEKEAEIAKDWLEDSGWTIDLSKKLVIVWSPLHENFLSRKSV